MKNGAWRASAPLLSMMAGLPAAAQVAQPSVEDVGQASIDIAGAVAMTLARHPEIARSNAALARGQADLGAAKSAWTPQLTYQANLGPNMFSRSSGSGLNDNMAGPSLYLQQRIWDFGRAKGEIGYARSTEEQRRYELESVADQLAEQAALAFLQVKRFELLGREAARQVEALEHLRELIGLRVDAGISDKSDLMLANVRVDSARGDAILAESSLITARAALANLTGAMPTVYQDPNPQITRFGAAEEEPDFASLPAIVAADKAEQAAAARVGQAKAERYPQLGLQLGYTRNNYTYNERNNAFSALVTVTGDLYKRGTRYQVRAAEEERRAARSARDSVLLDARGRALTARQEIRGGALRIEAFSHQEKQAEEASRIFFEEYKLGKRTLTELLNTQLEIYRAASARIVAEYDVLAARIRFENVRGTLRPSLGLPARLTEGEEEHG
ncbi:transporter [Sphingobium sp. TA15]|uniref:TolC family protein n=1 Tax=Sphingobium sp. TA15 TaxID=2905832 RepID=UPI00308D9E84|nr:transporter [Sphingobium sp. TA15]